MAKPAFRPREETDVHSAVSRLNPARFDTLDRGRKFGTIGGNEFVGDPPKRAFYEQNDRLYDNNGQRLFKPGQREAEIAAYEESVKNIAKRPVPTKQGAKAAPAPVEDPEDADDPNPPMDLSALGARIGAEVVEDEEVNLTDWGNKFLANQSTGVPFNKIRKAIRTRHHKDVTNEDDAVDFLIAEKIVTPRR